MASKYPIVENEETVRPYRLWDANAKGLVRYRCYLHLRSALIGAYVETCWGKVGMAVEVIDITTGALFGQFVRLPTGIQSTKIKRE
jgi:hypothetical protein